MNWIINCLRWYNHIIYFHFLTTNKHIFYLYYRNRYSYPYFSVIIHTFHNVVYSTIFNIWNSILHFYLIFQTYFKFIKYKLYFNKYFNSKKTKPFLDLNVRIYSVSVERQYVFFFFHFMLISFEFVVGSYSHMILFRSIIHIENIKCERVHFGFYSQMNLRQ